MADTITIDLRRMLEDLSKREPERRLQFIVSLHPDASAAGVAAVGMTIDDDIAAPRLLLGRMTPEQALAAARLDTVERIECDSGGVKALGGFKA
ncbi:MAG: hypothetical protein ABI665_07520 [Vicinamibacterales bacterium]